MPNLYRTTRVAIRDDRNGPNTRLPSYLAIPEAWRDAIATVLTLWVIVASVVWMFYANAYNELRVRTRAQLIGMAEMAAMYVDPDQHGKFTNPTQEKSEEYLGAIHRLGTAMRDFHALGGFYEGVSFVYTMVMRGQDFFFVLDPTPPGDADGDGVDDKSHIMERYDDPSPDMMEAIRQGLSTADEAPYPDKWGFFISGYAPILDAKGQNVGIVGVDVNAAIYLEQIRALQWNCLRCGLLGFALSLLLGIPFGVHSAAIRREVLRQKHLSEELSHQIDTYRRQLQLRDENLATLFQEVNAAVENLQRTFEDDMRGTLLPQRWAETRELTQAVSTHLHCVMDDMLDAICFNMGRVRLRGSAFRVHQLLESIMQVVKVANTPHRPVRMAASADIPSVIGDAAKIRQVLLHYLRYALQHTREGMIEFSATVLQAGADPVSHQGANQFRIRPLPATIPAQHLRICLEVKDSGLGIPKHKIDTIFGEHAPSLDDLKQVTDDNALGLSICRRLSEALGAEIGVASRLGMGSVFWLTLDLPMVNPEIP